MKIAKFIKAIVFCIVTGLIPVLVMPLVVNTYMSTYVLASTDRIVDPSRPMIALTFDDGPTLDTVQILDILEQYNSAATFFVVGQRVHEWSEVIQRIYDNGSEAVGHSWNHPSLTELSKEEIAWQLAKTHYAIEEVLETSVPKIFRPPFSAQNETVRRVARDLGFSIIDWSVDTEDWRIRDAEIIAHRVLDFVQDGDIVVMHDLGVPETATAMEIVIPELIYRGYQLVTVSELFYYREVELLPGKVYDSARP